MYFAQAIPQLDGVIHELPLHTVTEVFSIIDVFKNTLTILHPQTRVHAQNMPAVSLPHSRPVRCTRAAYGAGLHQISQKPSLIRHQTGVHKTAQKVLLYISGLPYYQRKPLHRLKYTGLSTMPTPYPDDTPCLSRKHSRNIDQYSRYPSAKDFSDRMASTSVPLLSQQRFSVSFLITLNTADSRQTPGLGELPYSSFRHQYSRKDTVLLRSKRHH